MAENTVYVDGNKLDNIGLILNESNRKREYDFLVHIADFISNSHYYVERGVEYWVLSSLSKKKIKEILDMANIPYSSFYTKGHLGRRTVFVRFWVSFKKRSKTCSHPLFFLLYYSYKYLLKYCTYMIFKI